MDENADAKLNTSHGNCNDAEERGLESRQWRVPAKAATVTGSGGSWMNAAWSTSSPWLRIIIMPYLSVPQTGIECVYSGSGMPLLAMRGLG